MNTFFWRNGRNAGTDQVPAFASERGEAPRVVVESRDLAERWAIESILRRAGFEVVSCSGPEQLPSGRCPLVAGEGCPAVVEADAVFYRLDLPDAANEQVLGALNAYASRRPIVVEVPQPRARQLAELLDGCRVLSTPASGAEIVSALAAATASVLPA
jgi:hypothetical protein